MYELRWYNRVRNIWIRHDARRSAGSKVQRFFFAGGQTLPRDSTRYWPVWQRAHHCVERPLLFVPSLRSHCANNRNTNPATLREMTVPIIESDNEPYICVYIDVAKRPINSAALDRFSGTTLVLLMFIKAKRGALPRNDALSKCTTVQTRVPHAPPRPSRPTRDFASTRRYEKNLLFLTTKSRSFSFDGWRNFDPSYSKSFRFVDSSRQKPNIFSAITTGILFFFEPAILTFPINARRKSSLIMKLR